MSKMHSIIKQMLHTKKLIHSKIVIMFKRIGFHNFWIILLCYYWRLFPWTLKDHPWTGGSKQISLNYFQHILQNLVFNITMKYLSIIKMNFSFFLTSYPIKHPNKCAHNKITNLLRYYPHPPPPPTPPHRPAIKCISQTWLLVQVHWPFTSPGFCLLANLVRTLSSSSIPPLLNSFFSISSFLE